MAESCVFCGGVYSKALMTKSFSSPGRYICKKCAHWNQLPTRLRALEEKVILRVGGHHSVSVFTADQVLEMIDEVIAELEKEDS